MTQVGAILFDVKLNLASIDSQVRALQGRLSSKDLTIPIKFPKIDGGFAKDLESALKRQTQAAAALTVELTKAAAAAERLAKAQSSVPKQSAPRQSAPTAPAKPGPSREGRALEREFEKTAAAAERIANAAAKADFSRQEKEAAALARELAKAESAAQKAAQQTQRINLSKQQKEVEAFSREFDRAAAASERLNKQQQADKGRLAGASFSKNELAAVESAVKRVGAENKKAADTAALLRQQYGLTQGEIDKVVGKLNQANTSSSGLSSTLNNFGNNLIAKYISVQAAIDLVGASVRTLVGTFTEASSEFRKLEANLLSFQAKTQNITVDMAGLEDEINNVARTTSQTPATLSKTASTLVSLGVAGTEVEGRLKSLAQASDVLGESTDQLGIVTQAALASYSQYGVGVEEVTDTILQALNTTAIKDAREFEQLFSRAAAPASSLGVTLQELTAAFAVFREAGASPFASASALETGLNRIASRKDQLEREGINIAFKTDGGIDLEETLRELEKRTRDLAPTEKSSLLSKLFGEAVGSDLLTLLNKVEGSYATATENVNAFSGAQQRSFDIVSQGTDFQAGIVEGLVSTALTDLGKTLNPIEKGFISLQKSILETVSVDISPLSDAAERLGVVLAGNPELVDKLSEAFSQLAEDGVNGLVRIIDGVTVLANNDDAIEQLALGIRSVGSALETIGAGISFALALADSIATINSVLLDTPILGDAVRGALAAPFDPFGGAVRGALSGINESLVELRDNASGAFSGVFKSAIEGVIGVAEQLNKALERIPEIGGPIGAFLDKVSDRIDQLAERLENLLSRLPGAGSQPEIFEPAASTLADAAGAVLDGFGGKNIDPSGFDTSGFDERTPDEGPGADFQLKEFKRQQDIVLNGIEEASKQARTRLEGLDLPERDNAEQAAQIERTALEARLKNREKFLADLQALSGRQGISVEESTKIESEIAATEKAIADDRLAIAQNLRGQRQRTREEELRLFEEEKSIAESRLQLENQGRTDAVLSNQLSGVSSAQSAAEQIAAIQQDSTRQAIANKQTEIAEVRRLEGLKVFEAEDADARVRALQVELASLNGSLIQGEIDARANQIDEQLAGLQRIQEARQIEASIVDQAISNQRGLLEANLSITQALNQLDQTRLEGALNRARAEGDVFAAVSAQGAIFESQVKALEQEFAAKRATATITEAQTRLENQRAIAVAEVAAIEARLAVDKARNSGASAAEVADLTQIADLREAQVGSARDTAAVQDQILAKSREELGIQERLSAEKLRQNALDEARNKLTDAQRGIISALAAESNTSVQDSRDNLARIRDNLKEAQRAGLFQGGQGKVEGAIRDVQQALRSSNSDQALLRLLKQNPDNPQIRQLIDSIGRSDLTGLVEASENFKEATLNFDKALEVFGSTQKGTAEVRQAGIESAIGALGIDDRFGAVDALNVKNDPLAALGVVTDLQSQLDALRSSGRTGAGIDARAADLQGRIQAVQLQNPELTFPELLAQVQAIFAKISEEGFAAGTDIGNLTVTTPDPVADTSKIVNDIANMTASEVNA